MNMQDCIDACQRCHEVCLRMAMTHCLELGGRHTEPEHLRLMLNCAEICQTSANFMLSQSSVHGAVCGACAEVCTACADSCASVGDMDECVQACRHCAETCSEMASSYQPRMARRDAGTSAGAHSH
ncbi:four-helix bundle copper-binding protein [Zemynaea arenosa]|nr:four-helix bundle copper-binding protein [Massilia arenosa]